MNTGFYHFKNASSKRSVLSSQNLSLLCILKIHHLAQKSGHTLYFQKESFRFYPFKELCYKIVYLKWFISDQCKEIEDNNRMGKTRDLFKKIRDTKGTFYAKMATMKDRNGMDLSEAEDIKKRLQEYTQELYKKDLNDLDNPRWCDHSARVRHPGVQSQVGPLGSITMNKASGDDRISAELLQILKDDAVKVLHSKCQQIWKTQQWPQDWKSSDFIPIPKKGNVEECLNYHTIAHISQASKVMLKILQTSLQ